jgi:predicted secreted protein
LGRSDGGVRAHRLTLGLHKCHLISRMWLPEEEKLLGTAEDKEIARLLGLRGARFYNTQDHRIMNRPANTAIILTCPRPPIDSKLRHGRRKGDFRLQNHRMDRCP